MSVRITDDGSTIYNGLTVETPYGSEQDQAIQVEDFLQLMIAQLSNQDFMEPVDDSQYMAQLAQFASMESMQELSHYSQINYVSSLVGKTVTVASLGLGAEVNSEVGVVSGVNLSGEEHTVTVNGKTYTLSQIMSIDNGSTAVERSELENAENIALVLQDVGNDSISLRWTPPVADEDAASELRYDVYYTTDGSLDFSTLSGVKQGVLAGEAMSETEILLEGLESGKTHFINVVVTNQNGDQAIYQQSHAVTTG